MNTQKCKSCKKEFELTTNQPTAKYCSRECYREMMRRKNSAYVPFDRGTSEKRRASGFDKYFAANQ